MVEREVKTMDQERLAVEESFQYYEAEGFAEMFWTPYAEHKERMGQTYKVIGRATELDVDLERLPLWKIEFADGHQALAFPEEITLHEINYFKETLKGEFIHFREKE